MGQFGFQNANSPIIEELIFLHDFINLIFIFLILFFRYIIILMILNIFKSDKNFASGDKRASRKVNERVKRKKRKKKKKKFFFLMIHIFVANVRRSKNNSYSTLFIAYYFIFYEYILI